MNILDKNKNNFILILLILFSAIPAFAGNNTPVAEDSTFAFALELGGGFTSNLNPGVNGQRQPMFSPVCRIYWKPNHLLDLGIETSYILIKSENKVDVDSEFGKTDFKASLSGVPVIVAYRMNFQRLTLTGGIGAAYVNSTVDAFDTKVSVNFWYYCYYFSLGYSYKLSEKLDIGIEALTYSLPRIEQHLGGINLKISYDIFSW